MCGILGIYNFRGTSRIDKDKIKDAAFMMKHRGPDAYGQWGIENTIELAHLRLSIIDLNPQSNQPFFSSCGNYVIVFNGEIFNYLEIKDELKKHGTTFRTTSDTEVLLNSYIQWGESCVSRFNGDWAFAIYNLKENSLFCSRDRFGVKPFNYSIVNNQFIFSSEIKPILSYYPFLKRPNYNVISNFCRNSLGAQIEETWFENIKRLLPSHNLTIKNGNLEIKRYWDCPTQINRNIKYEDAVEEYKEIFQNAIELRMRSDVPVGSTLSSGIDSGSIVSVLRKFYSGEHKTFTAVFDQNEYLPSDKAYFSTNIVINEGSLVKKLSDELELKPYFIKSDVNNFCKELSDVIYFLESGHSSPATLPLSRVMSEAKKHVKVVLEGQGADELLGGYAINVFPFLIIELLKKGEILQAKNEYDAFKENYSLGYTFKQFLRLRNNNHIERLYQWRNGINQVFGQKLSKYCRIKDYPYDSIDFDDNLNRELFKSHSGSLVNLLHYGDAISLSKSVESRLPFMDVNLVEFVFQLPFNYKMHNGFGKYIHRDAMKNIVPEYILKNPYKFGFNTPLSQHFNTFDSEGIKTLFSDRCRDRGIFDGKGLEKLITKQISGKDNYATILFRLLSVEFWFRHFIDK